MGKYSQGTTKAGRTVARIVLSRYPDNRRLVERIEAEEIETGRTLGNGITGRRAADPTGNTVVRLSEDARYKRATREIQAVEAAMTGLDDVQTNVIRQRYWQHKAGETKPVSYAYLFDTGYAETTMKRISNAVICRLMTELGEE